MKQSIEIILSEDHGFIDTLYDQYLEAKVKDSKNALNAFKTYKAALLRHIKCEEDLIFPVLGRFPEEIAAQEVPTLREEHKIIIPLLMEVEKHLKEESDSSSSERRLFEELHEHNAREEMRVYEPLHRLLSESEKQRVADELKSMRFFTHMNSHDMPKLQ